MLVGRAWDLPLEQKSGFKDRCLTIIMGVRTHIYRHIQTYPDISGHIQTGYPDIRISNLWISGHPDKSRQIQTNPDAFRQPFRGEVYMDSQNQEERANKEQRASQDRVRPPPTTPPLCHSASDSGPSLSDGSSKSSSPSSGCSSRSLTLSFSKMGEGFFSL